MGGRYSVTNTIHEPVCLFEDIRANMDAGVLARGIAVVRRRGLPQPAWECMADWDAGGLHEFLQYWGGADIDFYFGVLLAWPSPVGDVETEENLGLALGTALDKAGDALESQGRARDSDVVLVCVVLNTKLAGVALDANRARNAALCREALPRMSRVLHANPGRSRFSYSQVLQVNSGHVDAASEASYHELYALYRQHRKETRPATTRVALTSDVMYGDVAVTTLEEVETPPNAAQCAFAGCQKEDGWRYTTKLACGGCRSVRYCDKECQRADWPTHKGMCAGMKAGRDAVKGL